MTFHKQINCVCIRNAYTTVFTFALNFVRILFWVQMRKKDNLIVYNAPLFLQGALLWTTKKIFSADLCIVLNSRSFLVKYRLRRCEVMAKAIVKYCASHKVKLTAPPTPAGTSLSAGQLHLQSKLHAPKGALSWKRQIPFGICRFLAEREGFEPSWDCSQTDFESYEVRVKTSQLCISFCQSCPRRKAA